MTRQYGIKKSRPLCWSWFTVPRQNWLKFEDLKFISGQDSLEYNTVVITISHVILLKLTKFK